MNLPENWLHYIGWTCFDKGYCNRFLAKVLEDEYIDAYIEKHGKRPRGNPPRRKSKFEQTLLDTEP